jgi:hypothetical protein
MPNRYRKIAEAEARRSEDSQILKDMQTQLENISSIMGDPTVLASIVGQAIVSERTCVRERNRSVEETSEMGGNAQRRTTDVFHNPSRPQAGRSQVVGTFGRSPAKSFTNTPQISHSTKFRSKCLVIVSTTLEDDLEADGSVDYRPGCSKVTETTLTIRPTLPFFPASPEIHHLHDAMESMV